MLMKNRCKGEPLESLLNFCGMNQAAAFFFFFKEMYKNTDIYEYVFFFALLQLREIACGLTQ